MLPQLDVLVDSLTPAGGDDHPLLQAYGSRLQLPGTPRDPKVIANFVTSLDGLVALGTAPAQGPSAIGLKNPADRFTMALLRALCDAVLIGAQTLRAHPHHQWTPEYLVPSLAGELRGLRSAAGKGEDWAPLVVVSGSGDIDGDHPGLRVAGQRVLLLLGAGAVPSPGLTAVKAAGPRWQAPDIVSAIGNHLSAGTILSEAGPQILGQLLEATMLEELFISIAPCVAGNGGEGRISLLQGFAFPAAAVPRFTLRSLRRGEDDLLLARYAVR